MKEFRVGDTVKIIANTNGSVNKIGDIGIITTIDTTKFGSNYSNSCHRVSVQGPNANSNRNYTRESDMEHYEEEWIPKVGDWIIRIINLGGVHANGRVLKIKSIMGKLIYTEQDGDINHLLSSVRKALPHEIPKEELTYQEDLSKVRYAEWEEGDIVIRTGGTSRAEFKMVLHGLYTIVKKFRTQIKVKETLGIWNADNFKLVKRKSSSNSLINNSIQTIQTNKENGSEKLSISKVQRPYFKRRKNVEGRSIRLGSTESKINSGSIHCTDKIRSVNSSPTFREC